MKAILYISFFLLIFSSCDVNRSRQYSIVSPEESINNIPADDFFYFNLKSAYYTGEKGTFDPLDFMIYALDDGPGTDCKIPVSQEGATEDLYCIMEVMEGDLWMHEITFEYNVPPGMCEYLGFIPHWHYNYRSGIGPPFVVKFADAYESCQSIESTEFCSNEDCNDKEKNACTGRDDNDTCRQNACENKRHTCNGAKTGTWVEGSCSDKTCSRYGKEACEDKEHTCKTLCCKTTAECNNENNKLLPCTSGTWTPPKCENSTNCKSQSACENTDKGIVDECHNEATAGTWEQRYECIIPAESISSKKAEDTCSYSHFPERSNTSAISANDNETQINCCTGNYTLYEPDGQKLEKWSRDEACIGGLARINWSEFRKEDGLPKIELEQTKGRQKDKEYTLKPLIDQVAEKKTNNNPSKYSLPYANYFSNIRDEDNLPDFYQNDGNPFITVSCLDSAYEVKHLIKVIIREWNTQEEFIKFKESNGSRGDPDTDGDEGSGCDYYDNNSMFSKCNDLTDADDQGDAYPELVYIGSGGGSSD